MIDPSTKGALCGTEVRGEILHLWFQSPTGDQSDSQILKLVCKDYTQAKAIEHTHRYIWGLEIHNQQPRELTMAEEAKFNEFAGIG
jgi:hypothetical protein